MYLLKSLIANNTKEYIVDFFQFFFCNTVWRHDVDRIAKWPYVDTLRQTFLCYGTADIIEVFIGSRGYLKSGNGAKLPGISDLIRV